MNCGTISYLAPSSPWDLASCVHNSALSSVGKSSKPGGRTGGLGDADSDALSIDTTAALADMTNTNEAT